MIGLKNVSDVLAGHIRSLTVGFLRVNVDLEKMGTNVSQIIPECYVDLEWHIVGI